MVLTNGKRVHEQVNRVLDQHKGLDQTNISVINKKIEDALFPRYREVNDIIYNEFRKFSYEKEIPRRQMKRRFQLLETQMRKHF